MSENLFHLIPNLKEEVRACTALAMCLAADSSRSLLRRMLKKISPCGNGKHLLDAFVAEIKDDRARVSFSTERHEDNNRFDIVLELTRPSPGNSKDERLRILIEAKVSAKISDEQLIRYLDNCQQWQGDNACTASGLVFLDRDAQAVADEICRHPNFIGCLTWKQVLECLGEEPAAGSSNLNRSLGALLRTFTMDLNDYTKLLQDPDRQEPSFVALRDALDLLCRKLKDEFDGPRLNPWPTSSSYGPTWDDEYDAYYLGFWWRNERAAKVEWSGLYLCWYYCKKLSTYCLRLEYDDANKIHVMCDWADLADLEQIFQTVCKAIREGTRPKLQAK